MKDVTPLLDRVDTALSSRLWYMKPEFRREISLEVEEAVKLWLLDFAHELEE